MGGEAVASPRLFVLVALWVAVATFADVQFKAAGGAVNGKFAIGLACYGLTALIALATLHQMSWGWIILVWNCLSLGLSLAISVLLYDEPLTWRRAAAGALLTAALFLTE